ncbi:hypothetical protein SDC9_153391 [bioreactor metagenome]|uniref:Uncharacterized protein n=1 Tax=bioreactor metagenome TaxID=1076179 RepID=A0A645EXJ6_9ZZZZ
MHAGGGRRVGDRVTEGRVAFIRERHVLDEVRQFVGGIDALPRRRAVDVVAGIDQPVRVEHDAGVDAELDRTTAELALGVDGGLAAAVGRARLFGNKHRRHMCALDGHDDFTHVAVSL